METAFSSSVMYPFPYKVANIMAMIVNTVLPEPKTPLSSISQLPEGDLEVATHDRFHGDDLEGIFAEANKEIASFQKHYVYVVKHWRNMATRILGFIHFSPPIVVELPVKLYTHD